MSDEHETLLCGIFSNAITFNIAGQVLRDQVNLSGDHSREWNDRFRGESVGWPWQVNEAFAVELYLKCVLLMENNLISGHELKVLFKKISIQVQNEIREIYNKEIKTQLWFQEFVQNYSQIPRHHEFELDDIINDANKVFVNFRYSHEHYVDGSLNKSLLIQPIKIVLYRWIVKRKPELHRPWMQHS